MRGDLFRRESSKSLSKGNDEQIGNMEEWLSFLIPNPLELQSVVALKHFAFMQILTCFQMRIVSSSGGNFFCV